MPDEASKCQMEGSGCEKWLVLLAGCAPWLRTGLLPWPAQPEGPAILGCVAATGTGMHPLGSGLTISPTSSCNLCHSLPWHPQTGADCSAECFYCLDLGVEGFDVIDGRHSTALDYALAGPHIQLGREMCDAIMHTVPRRIREAQHAAAAPAGAAADAGAAAAAAELLACREAGAAKQLSSMLASIAGAAGAPPGLLPQALATTAEIVAAHSLQAHFRAVEVLASAVERGTLDAVHAVLTSQLAAGLTPDHLCQAVALAAAYSDPQKVHMLLHHGQGAAVTWAALAAAVHSAMQSLGRDTAVSQTADRAVELIHTLLSCGLPAAPPLWLNAPGGIDCPFFKLASSIERRATELVSGGMSGCQPGGRPVCVVGRFYWGMSVAPGEPLAATAMWHWQIPPLHG